VTASAIFAVDAGVLSEQLQVADGRSRRSSLDLASRFGFARLLQRRGRMGEALEAAFSLYQEGTPHCVCEQSPREHAHMYDMRTQQHVAKTDREGASVGTYALEKTAPKAPANADPSGVKGG